MFGILEIKLFWITLGIPTVLTAIYVYLKYFVYNYWKIKKVPHEAPSIPFGNIPISHITGKVSFGNVIKKNYDKLKQHPFHGLYILHKPVIMINDPELIRIVLVKEFHRFCDRGWFIDEKLDPMSNNLFQQPGDKWKRLRGKFSPTFSPGKLRQIYPLMAEVCDEMTKICDAELKSTGDVDIKGLIARYTTDIISSIVYGMDGNTLKNPNNDFRRFGIRAFEFGRINLLIAIFFPELLESITLPFHQKEVRDFFAKIFNDAVVYRRKAKVLRKDFMNLLIQLIDEGKVEDVEEDEKSSDSIEENKVDNDRISMAEAAAHAYVFFLAGFETSSSAATYCLFELAMNPEMQENIQQEIDKVVESSGGLTFDAIMDMEYLDMVLLEAMRKYTSVPYLNRICMEDFHIPNSNYTIPKGMRVLISNMGIQHDPKYFPDPEKFDPSRYSKENLATRSTYVNTVFGEGPRTCIGKRFAILDSKLAIATLLRNYKFRVSYRTSLPIKYKIDNFILTPEDAFYLRAEPRRK